MYLKKKNFVTKYFTFTFDQFNVFAEFFFFFFNDTKLLVLLEIHFGNAVQQKCLTPFKKESLLC